MTPLATPSFIFFKRYGHPKTRMDTSGVNLYHTFYIHIENRKKPHYGSRTHTIHAVHPHLHGLIIFGMDSLDGMDKPYFMRVSRPSRFLHGRTFGVV